MAAGTEHISLNTWASIATAVFTAAIALLTGWLARSTIQEGRRSTGLQLFSQMVDTYQADPMRILRSRLARTLQSNFTSSPTGAVPDPNWVLFESVDLTVWEFFENMGRLVRDGALDAQITWNYFSDAILAYWTASQATILSERKRTKEFDLFSEFEWLAKAFAARDGDGRLLLPPREMQPQRCLEFLASEVRLHPLVRASFSSR